MASPAVDQSQLGLFIMVGAGVGAAIGGWPASLAMSRGRPGMAIFSVVACLLAGALGGCLFAAPLAWILSLIIKGMSPTDEWDSTSGIAYEDYRREMRRYGGGNSRRWSDDAPGPRAPDQPYSAIGHVLVCNGCRQSTSKGPGGVIPPECPTCGLRFAPQARTGPARRSGPRAARLAGDSIVELRSVDDRTRR